MTREEAIRRFENVKANALIQKANGVSEYWQGEIDGTVEAIDMAIEALKILGEDGIVNCCGCIHWKSDGGAMMECELWKTPMGDFDYCSFGDRGDTE